MEYRIEQYCYRVRWSAEDEEYVGTVAEFPSLSWLDSDQIEAFRGIVELVREVVSDMEQSQESIPEPFSVRSYSGNIRLRMPSEQHRDLSILAAEEGVSLNRLICSLVGRGMQGSCIRSEESNRYRSIGTPPTSSPICTKRLEKDMP